MNFLTVIVIVLLLFVIIYLVKNDKKRNDAFNKQLDMLNTANESFKKELQDKLNSAYKENEENKRNNSELQDKLDELNKENEEIKVYYRKALKIIEESKEAISNQVSLNNSIAAENNRLKRNNEKLASDLSFYTDIKEESLKLNDITKKDFRITIDTKTLNKEQSKLYKIMNKSNDNLFITGKAGTGKSYLLRCFKDNTDKKVLYCAPTGVAAINIGAVTIHSAFGFLNINNGSPYKIGDNERALLENIDSVVIDEISMVRSDTFTRIDEILKKVRNSTLPFGGVQMIVIGDVFQLPPVITDGEYGAFLSDNFNGIYFFNTDAYKNGDFKCYELNTIVRQNDKKFIDVLNSVREGTITEDQINYLNTKYVDKLPENNRIIRVVPTKKQASSINSKELSKIKSREYVFDAQVILGTEKIKENEFPCDFRLKLKLGCLIMMLVNDNQEKRYVNGTLGIVSDINENMVKVSIDGCEYEISRQSFKKTRAYYDRKKKEIIYENELVVNQFPLIPAYAITVHKSQGATYQTVAIDVSNTFSTGQTYVSLSRCSNFENLYLLSKITPDTILVDNEVVNFYNQLPKNIYDNNSN